MRAFPNISVAVLFLLGLSAGSCKQREFQEVEASVPVSLPRAPSPRPRQALQSPIAKPTVSHDLKRNEILRRVKKVRTALEASPVSPATTAEFQVRLDAVERLTEEEKFDLAEEVVGVIEEELTAAGKAVPHSDP